MTEVSIGIVALKSALKFLASCFAQNKIDKFIDGVSSFLDESDQVAVQFYQALDEAYRRTCKCCPRTTRIWQRATIALGLPMVRLETTNGNRNF